jgi:hypothetical protein
VSQRGKSARMSVLHGIAGALAVLAGFTRRAPGRSQDQGTRRTGGPSQKIARPGHRPLGTNLTFASLVAREWLRRRLPTEAARPGAARGPAAASRAAAPDCPAPEGTTRRCGDASWAATPAWAAEPDGAAEACCALDPEWAAETGAADRDRVH